MTRIWTRHKRDLGDVGLALLRLGVIPRTIAALLPLVLAAAFLALVTLYAVAAVKHWEVRGVVTSS